MQLRREGERSTTDVDLEAEEGVGSRLVGWDVKKLLLLLLLLWLLLLLLLLLPLQRM